ncbi:hypothetical protein BJ684DRAFT_16537 [Piptocephalis cylindrospora]|uniref:Uncharacterized protein n=1 Tax=Piptocephalis cylindrospora TaxID=1907219 RepID=A0A4P9Y2B4_9FUNG|nr:hypothetical protein BJ684DRAFT_16537 [Piptocephalis cylindrospora]|eukprot:RKP13026.1 hypothetical protein BJ684DRAFT_16537 [Piptocephalis cylindrospora]
MSLDHQPFLHSSSQALPILHPSPPRESLFYVKTSYGRAIPNNDSVSDEQKKEYAQYNTIYAGLIFMMSAQLSEKSIDNAVGVNDVKLEISSEHADETDKEYELLNKVVKIHCHKAHGACKLIKKPTQSDPDDPLSLRSSDSLIDIYCDVMSLKQCDRIYSYGSLVIPFREAIGYSQFLHESKRPDPFGGDFEPREGSVPFSPAILHNSLQVVVNALVMERFYVRPHTPFGSLNEALSSFRHIMSKLFDPVAERILEAQNIMVGRLSTAKGSFNSLAAQSATHRDSTHSASSSFRQEIIHPASSSSHQESTHFAPPSPRQRSTHPLGLSPLQESIHHAPPSPFQGYDASLVKKFGDLFPSTSLLSRTYPKITEFLESMCKQMDDYLPQVIRERKRGGRIAFVRNRHLASRDIFYRTVCSPERFQIKWTSRDNAHWHFEVDVKDKIMRIPRTQLIGRYLEEWIYKVRFLQLVRYLQPFLVKLPITKKRWDTLIDTASKRIRLFVTSIYIHSVLFKPNLFETLAALDVYRDMLSSISDDSFVTQNNKSEQEALSSFRVKIPESVKMERKVADSYKGKFGKTWVKMRGKRAWVKWCKSGAAKVLRSGLEWASTPKGQNAPKNPAKTFAQYTVTLKTFLLEAHNGGPVELSGEDLSPEAVKKTLSSKKP